MLPIYFPLKTRTEHQTELNFQTDFTFNNILQEWWQLDFYSLLCCKGLAIISIPGLQSISRHIYSWLQYLAPRVAWLFQHLYQSHQTQNRQKLGGAKEQRVWIRLGKTHLVEKYKDIYILMEKTFFINVQ